ncbi:MAG: D-alanine--D-alanine ligase [Actinomycetota bacterium]|nr:D-alanine--D-alanine ligase [Actinomycetota bacterium]
MTKLTVGVVFGGRSVEHDVSIVTAHQAMAALRPNFEVVPIYVTREGRWLTSPALDDLEVHRGGRASEVGEDAFIPTLAGFRGLFVPGGRFKGTKRIPLDVVLPSIHGTFGEDGTLQGLLELADIPYVGAGVVGSAVGMDKAVMKGVLKEAGLQVVPHIVVEASMLARDEASAVDLIARRVGYPAFVKPARAGSSVGIAMARDETSLRAALDVARRYDRRIVVEQAMEGCSEINCSVLGGPGMATRASVCEQPVAWEEFLSFSDKYLRGGKGAEGKGGGMASLERRIPAPISEALTKEVQRSAIAAFEAVDASGVARVDMFVGEATDETWVMEINTVPGSFSFYLWEASGLGFSDLLRSAIDIAIATHARRSELMFTFDSDMLTAAKGGKRGG